MKSNSFNTSIKEILYYYLNKLKWFREILVFEKLLDCKLQNLLVHVVNDYRYSVKMFINVM